MSLSRYLPLVVASVCFNVSAQPLQEAIQWMSEAQPFDPVVVERHFGVKPKMYCATQPWSTTWDCTTDDKEFEMVVHAKSEGGEFMDGRIGMPVIGCMSRREAEEVLGTRLGYEADSAHGISPVITLYARHWTPTQTWKVGVAFKDDCALKLSIRTLPF